MDDNAVDLRDRGKKDGVHSVKNIGWRGVFTDRKESKVRWEKNNNNPTLVPRKVERYRIFFHPVEGLSLYRGLGNCKCDQDLKKGLYADRHTQNKNLVKCYFFLSSPWRLTVMNKGHK